MVNLIINAIESNEPKSPPEQEAVVNELLSYAFHAAEGWRHRSLPGFRQRPSADPACCRGGNLARMASSGLNMNLRSRPNLTQTGRRDRRADALQRPHDAGA